VAGASRFADQALLLDQPRVGCLVAAPMGAAHHDRRREVTRVGQRLTLVELHALELEAAREQLVLERRRRLTGAVLQDEQGQGHAAQTVPAGAGTAVATTV
jgi:hypothetical protein